MQITEADTLTMSSQEISGLVGSRHDKVKQSIERLVEKGVISQPPMGGGGVSGNGVTTKCYLLSKRDSYIVVAQLSPEFTATLVDRWQELEEAQPVLPDFSNPAIAARAWADEVEAKDKALKTIEEKDKLIIAVADLNIKAGMVTIADFAKNIALEGLGQNTLYRWLRGRGYLNADNAPYQAYVNRGYFRRKPYQDKIKGEVKYKTFLTARGTAWLSKILHAEFEID